MTTTELLQRLSERGVSLTVEDGALKYRGPKGGLTPELRAAIASSKAELLELLAAAARADELSFLRDPTARWEPFPLTDLQQAYLIGEREFYADRTVAHLYQQYRVAELDRDRFLRAAERVMFTHDVLRLAILPDGRQVVRREVPPLPVWEDLRSLPEHEATGHIERKARDMPRELPDLEAGCTWSVSVQQFASYHVVHVAVRLFAFDAVTLHTIYRDLIGFYTRADYVPVLGALSFRDYVLGLERHKESRAYQRSLAYWKARAPELPAAPDLPRARGSKSPGRGRLIRLSGRLSPERWSRLREHALAAGRPINSVLGTVYTDTIARWTTGGPFTINMLSANRPPVEPATAQVVGNCSTTTLVAVAERAPTFAERVERLQRRLYADLAHNIVSGVETIRQLARLRPGTGEPPMPVVFSSGIGLVPGDERFELLVPHPDWKLVDARLATPQVWLDHQVMEEGGELVFNWDYASEHFPIGMIEEMFEHYRLHLQALSDEREAWHAPASPLPEPHLRARRRANRTELELPGGTLYALFAETTRRHAERPALLAETGTFTYGEVRAFVEEVSTALRRCGVGRGDLVGIHLPKSAEQIVAVLGVLHAGAAYLPLDAKLPPARVRQILAHSRAKAVLVAPAAVAALELPSEVVTVPLPARPRGGSTEELPPAPVTDDEVAYVIYTSGSTGQPKGVVIDHRGAVNTIRDVVRRFGMGEEDRFLALSSLGFDLSVFDIFGALAVGAAVVVPPEEETPNPQLWLDAHERFRVTIWNSVPALLEMTLDYLGEREALLLNDLRVVLLSGDWVPLPLVARLLRGCPTARVVSLGGATEASIWSNYFEVAAIDPTWTSVPYGFPLANQTFSILDREMNPTPTWVMGDLYIGGMGLAKGYLNDPDKTAASFLEHPVTGERLYRTGDRGCYLPDGAIEFLGREDAQVKIRGFRVELGEIEAVLRGMPGVEGAAAVVQGSGRLDQRLVAFVVAPGLPNEQLGRLLDELSEKLPGYMVPAEVVSVPALPLSANGKVDRTRLKQIAPAPQQQPARVARPLETPAEIQLGALWRDVLKLEDVQADDDFFSVGGNSLQAVRLFSGIERTFGRSLPLSSLFRTRTLAAQAALLTEMAQERAALTGAERGPVVLKPGSRDAEVLVLVHPVGGDILCYHELSQRLPDWLTVVGLRSPALHQDEVPADVVFEQLAASHVQLVEEAFPRRRVHLGGWSMGGVLAFESARQMRAAHRDVGQLFLIDSWLGSDARAPRGEPTMVQDFFVDLLGDRSVRALLRDLVDAPSGERLPRALTRLHESGRLHRDVAPTQAARLYAVYSSNMRALERYRPGRYVGPVTLFRARQQSRDGFPNLQSFSERSGELLPEGASTIELQLDHYEIMARAGLEVVAEHIAAALRELRSTRMHG